MCHSNALGEESEEWTCGWPMPCFVASTEDEQPIRIATKESRPHDFFKVPEGTMTFLILLSFESHVTLCKLGITEDEAFPSRRMLNPRFCSRITALRHI